MGTPASTHVCCWHCQSRAWEVLTDAYQSETAIKPLVLVLRKLLQRSEKWVGFGTAASTGCEAACYRGG